jgi:hypothetical protein
MDVASVLVMGRAGLVMVLSHLTGVAKAAVLAASKMPTMAPTAIGLFISTSPFIYEGAFGVFPVRSLPHGWLPPRHTCFVTLYKS